MPDDKRITSGSMETIILACLHYIERNHLLDSGPTQARAAKSGCRLSFLPIYRRKPSAAARRRALAGVNRDIAAVCKASGPDHNTLHLKARRKATTLNKLFGGKHALANLQRSAPAGSHDGANPRMTVSWNH
jgi:hypothetical protein